MGPWITAIGAAHLVRAVAAAGGDAARAARTLGVTGSTAFEDRVALATLVDEWERALAETGRRDLPVLAATRTSHDEKSLVGFCAVNQPTIGDAFAILDRYFAAVSDGYAWRVIDDGDVVRVRAQPVGPVGREGWQAYLEFESIDLVAIARRVTRGRAVAVGASYVHAPHAASPAIARALGVEPVWHAPWCELVFPQAVRALAIDGARANLAAIVGARLDALVAATSVVARARGRIGELIARGEVSVDALARALAMSRRSLERALAGERTSAAALFDEARLALALAWLPSLTVDEVAARLGYSDARAFARAFRRWTGKPPSSVARR